MLAALEAAVRLVLIGQQVAPNSQNLSGERYTVLDWIKSHFLYFQNLR